METSEKFLAPLTFNKEGLAAIGNDPNSTGLAVGIILINAILGGLQVILGPQNPYQNLPGVDPNFGTAVFFFIGFFFYLLYLLFISWGIKVAAGWFGGKGKVDTMEVLRMIGFAALWNMVGLIIGFFISIGGIFGLLAIIAFSIGLGASAEIGPLKAFLSAIVGAIICIIVVFIFFIGIFLVLGILL